MKYWTHDFFFWGSLLAAALIFTNCASPSLKPIDPEIGYVEAGIASWYGPGFHGKLTASGERYDMYQMTAAHKRLPLGTIVKVRSLTTGRSVTVKINDRGPFIRGRIIDLSYAAARSLRMIGKGTERVRLKVLKKPQSSGPYWVQVSAFDDLQEARAFRGELQGDFPRVRVVSVKLSTGRWYRVQVGEFQTERRAQAAARKLKANWGVTPLVVGP
jgi:rare lipoprotein A